MHFSMSVENKTKTVLKFPKKRQGSTFLSDPWWNHRWHFQRGSLNPVEMHTHSPFCFPSQKPPIGDSNTRGTGLFPYASLSLRTLKTLFKTHPQSPWFRQHQLCCLIGFGDNLMQPGLASNSLCNQGWPLTSYSPASTSRVCWDNKSVSPLCTALEEWIYEFRMLCTLSLLEEH